MWHVNAFVGWPLIIIFYSSILYMIWLLIIWSIATRYCYELYVSWTCHSGRWCLVIWSRYMLTLWIYVWWNCCLGLVHWRAGYKWGILTWLHNATLCFYPRLRWKHYCVFCMTLIFFTSPASTTGVLSKSVDMSWVMFMWWYDFVIFDFVQW